jgi:hypothetical protein
VHVEDGYHLVCNRDERRTRLAAAPPAPIDVRGVQAIAPLDGDFGGTWIGVNEVGVALCLLNRYPADENPSRAFTSRGRLVLDLLDAPSRIAVRERLSDEDLSVFRPFTLVALAPGEPALIARWTGQTCLFEYDGEYSMPLVSSAFEQERVAAFRRRLLLGGGRSARELTPEDLARFHRSHEPRPGPYSVCMHRDDAETVSLTWVRVDGDRIELEYTPGAPCANADPTTASIARVARPLR